MSTIRGVNTLADLRAFCGANAALPDAIEPPPAEDCDEATFQARVIALAKSRNWIAYHTHDSRRSEKGWPDLVLCRPPRLLIWELKSATGTVKPAQKKWLALLYRCDGVEAGVYWPRDWSKIEELLR